MSIFDARSRDDLQHVGIPRPRGCAARRRGTHPRPRLRLANTISCEILQHAVARRSVYNTQPLAARVAMEHVAVNRSTSRRARLCNTCWHGAPPHIGRGSASRPETLNISPRETLQHPFAWRAAAYRQGFCNTSMSRTSPAHLARAVLSRAFFERRSVRGWSTPVRRTEDNTAPRRERTHRGTFKIKIRARAAGTYPFAPVFVIERLVLPSLLGNTATPVEK